MALVAPILRATRQKALGLPLEEAEAALVALGNDLRQDAMSELTAQGVTKADTHIHAHIRYAGTDTALTVEGAFADLGPIFEDLHRRRFGFITAGKALVIDAAEVECVGGAAPIPPAPQAELVQAEAAGDPTRFYSQGVWHDAQVIRREAINAGNTVTGPAIIIEPNQTIVIEGGWQATLSAADYITLKRIHALPLRHAMGTEADPVMLEIFNNLFMSIPEQRA